jgi:hypothetical protein
MPQRRTDRFVGATAVPRGVFTDPHHSGQELDSPIRRRVATVARGNARKEI